MFIPKRWLVPGALSVALLAMIMAVALAGLGRPASSDAAANPYLDTELARSMSDPSLCGPVAETVALTPQQREDIRLYLEALERNKTLVVTDAATNSGEITDSQFNDGGFGDIGQQWREVQIGAPITNIHISGSDNVTTIVVGDDNTVVVTEDPVVVEAPAETLDPSLVSVPVPEAPVVVAPTAPQPDSPTPEGTT